MTYEVAGRGRGHVNRIDHGAVLEDAVVVAVGIATDVVVNIVMEVVVSIIGVSFLRNRVPSGDAPIKRVYPLS